jgi:hypothetical protein
MSGDVKGEPYLFVAMYLGRASGIMMIHNNNKPWRRRNILRYRIVLYEYSDGPVRTTVYSI